MKKFKITASSLQYFTLEIEAETLEEAERMARDADGGDFTAEDDGDWSIYSVQEVTQ